MPAGIDATAAAGLLLLGTVVIAADQEPSPNRGIASLLIGLPSLAVGALYALSASHGYTANSECERLQREDRVEALTSGAVAAGRSGDCPTVVSIDAQVSALDHDFRDRVFARDAVIAACLRPTPPSSR